MKKMNIMILILILGAGANVFAENPNNGFSTGGMVVMETSNTGGTAEIGFSIFEKNNITIRNHILFTGFGYDGGGIIALGDKVIIGGFTDNGMRPYTFIEGHMGLYKSNGKEFTELPLYFDAKGGGGIDIYTSEGVSFFVEVGGGISLYGEDFTGAAHLAAGFRTFWN